MQRRSMMVALALTGLMSTVAVAVASAPAAAAVVDPTAWYVIVNRNSGKALDVYNFSTADGGRITQWSRTNANNQQWQFVDSGGGYYRIRSRHSGKVLDVYNLSTADNAAVVQWADHNGTNQQFRLVDSPDGHVRLINRNSNKAVAVQNSATTDGANIVQFTDNGGNGQQWQLVRASGGDTYPPTGPLCNSSDVIDMGKYWIPNNQWGAGTGSGSQCIWSSGGSGDRISWGTSYNWSGQAGTVKSFAAAILGWHWGWRRPNTGLPVQLSANRNINTSWQFSVTRNGTVNQNVVYDCWFHPMANPGSSDQPTDELMIWLYRSNAYPAGSRQATVTIAGTTWELWRGVVGTWNVYSYVRTTNTTNATLNMRDFTNDLVGRGWMSNSKYLTSVQAGPEIFIGNGRVDTSSYSVTIS